MNKLGWLIAAVFVAGVGAFIWQATRPAPQTVGSSMDMTPPDTTQIAEGAAIVSVSLPENVSSDAEMGKRAFESVCAACHGQNAAGRNGIAPPLVHRIYEPSHHADEAFQRAVQNGVRAHHWNFGNMPPIEGLTRADVQYITRYVRELQRANGIQ